MQEELSFEKLRKICDPKLMRCETTDGTLEEGTVNYRVDKRLKEMAEKIRVPRVNNSGKEKVIKRQKRSCI